MNKRREYIPLEGLNDRQQQIRERRGRRYRVLADTSTYGRTAIGFALSAGILAGGSVLPKQLQHRTIGLAFSMAGLIAADKADGFFARRSAKNGIPILDIDKKKDPFQDKIFAQTVMSAIAIREALDGHEVYAGAIVIAQGTKLVRDYKITKSRENARPGADVSAIAINKYKTGLEGVAHTLAVSPLTQCETGRALTAGVYATSSVLGAIGYHIANERYQQVPVAG